MLRRKWNVCIEKISLLLLFVVKLLVLNGASMGDGAWNLIFIAMLPHVAAGFSRVRKLLISTIFVDALPIFVEIPFQIDSICRTCHGL